jgi:galactokinase
VRLASTAVSRADRRVLHRPARSSAASRHWANYSRGVAAELLAAGIPLIGMDALISNTLPVGGGLSSSAAIEVATGLAFWPGRAGDRRRSRLALICQKAEHEYALVPCGIMDQMIVTSARAGHAMLLRLPGSARGSSSRSTPTSCAWSSSTAWSSTSFPAASTPSAGAAVRPGVAFFQPAKSRVTALRDVTMKQVEEARGQLDELVYRARHVVTENAAHRRGAAMLGRNGNTSAPASSWSRATISLRDDYEVSCPELDFLADPGG